MVYIHGDENTYKSLRSTKEYTLGETVLNLEGEILSSPTKTSIEIGINKHIEDKFGKYMNHSFEPNTVIRECSVIAIKDILPGDELTFDYTENETNIAYPFVDKMTQKYVK